MTTPPLDIAAVWTPIDTCTHYDGSKITAIPCLYLIGFCIISIVSLLRLRLTLLQAGVVTRLVFEQLPVKRRPERSFGLLLYPCASNVPIAWTGGPVALISTTYDINKGYTRGGGDHTTTGRGCTFVTSSQLCMLWRGREPEIRQRRSLRGTFSLQSDTRSSHSAEPGARPNKGCNSGKANIQKLKWMYPIQYTD